jgi:hypothetical protein
VRLVWADDEEEVVRERLVLDKGALGFGAKKRRPPISTFGQHICWSAASTNSVLLVLATIA